MKPPVTGHVWAPWSAHVEQCVPGVLGLLDPSLNEDGLLEVPEPLALHDRSLSEEELLLTGLPELSMPLNEELEGLEGLTDRSKLKLVGLLGLPPPVSLGPAARTCEERGSTITAAMTANPAATSTSTLRCIRPCAGRFDRRSESY